VAALHGLFSNSYVLLLDNTHTLPEIKNLLHAWLTSDKFKSMKMSQRSVRINSEELSLLRQLLCGWTARHGSKAYSQIKCNLMRKTGAKNRAAFMIRLRLLFYPDRFHLLQVPIYSPSRRGQKDLLNIHWLRNLSPYNNEFAE
jgi:hypothetical protein